MQRSLLALLGGALVFSSSPARVSKPGSIEGAWQAVEVKVTGPSPRIITVPEPRANLTIITAKHYSRVEDHSDTPRPTSSDMATATADELRAVCIPFMGEAGTYEITGDNVITMWPNVAKNPSAMARGAFITRTFRRQGDTLWITDQRNQSGLIAYPATAKLVRVE